MKLSWWWNEGIIFGGDERKANIEVTLYRIVGYGQESVWCILNYTKLYSTAYIVHGSYYIPSSTVVLYGALNKE